MNNPLSTLRQLLSQPPSPALWWKIIALLEQAAPSEQAMLDEYIREHTLTSLEWIDARLPNGDWSAQSTGWELSNVRPHRVSGLSQALEVKCPAGSFLMGSALEDREALDTEKPTRQVTLTRDFWVMTTTVTQAQWQAFFGNNPSHFWQGEEATQRPVERVSWFDAVAFCNALSRAAGLEEAYVLTREQNSPGEDNYRCQVEWKGLDCPGYRLPTEAEWEYAARAGRRTSRYGTLNRVAWYDFDSFRKSHPVGQRQANAWGLHDTLGNVWEHCFDHWKRYEAGEVVDPVVDNGEHRVVRGGSWTDSQHNLRFSVRHGVNVYDRLSNVGIRVVRTA